MRFVHTAGGRSHFVVGLLRFMPGIVFLLALAFVGGTFAFGAAALPPLYVETLEGPITAKELDSFKAHIGAAAAGRDNQGNEWAMGRSSQEARSMALVYEATGDRSVLDRLVVFCDALLAARNDLAAAPTGQHKLWTGRIEPCWPNKFSEPIGAWGEQGVPPALLADCARLILKTKECWDEKVAGGDAPGHGVTYLARAKTFLAGAQTAIDGFVLPKVFVPTQLPRQYYCDQLRELVHAGTPAEVPWNQQIMFNYAFQNLAEALRLSGGSAEKAKRYDALVQASIDWFFNEGVLTVDGPKGRPVYCWAYVASRKIKSQPEDCNHANYDVMGFHRAWASGRYRLTREQMLPLANTFFDVITKGPGQYAGYVDGSNGEKHGAPTTSIRAGYLGLGELRSEDYRNLMSACFKPGSTTSRVDAYGLFLWLKQRRFDNSRR